MRMLRRLSIVPAVLLTAACVNYQYTGAISARDSLGEPRQAILYWSRTGSWLTGTKAGHAIVLTECGVRIRYDQQPGVIVFRGTPGEDRVPGQPPTASDDLDCGRFVDYESLANVEAGVVRLTVECEPITNEFSVTKTGGPRSYLEARDSPYVFPVTRRKSTTLFGRTPEVPEPPVCRHRGEEQ